MIVIAGKTVRRKKTLLLIFLPAFFCIQLCQSLEIILIAVRLIQLWQSFQRYLFFCICVVFLFNGLNN